MEQLCGYTLEGNMTGKDAGYSLWCFGKKNGKEYFIKQFLSPKYPYRDSVASPERQERKKKQCRAFTEQKRRIYDVVNNYSDGNDVRIYAFFRHESKYYMAMEKITALPWSVQDIAVRSEEEKRYLCAMVSHAVAALHRGGLIHADLKHENILYTKTANGNITAKVIDFDSGFLESDPPKNSEDISGDWVYFAPETWRRFNGEEIALTTKLDVFALGVLFHQYFSGEVPGFRWEDGVTSAGQAVLAGQELHLAPGLPPDVAELLGRMLDPDPEKRPTAYEAFAGLQPARIRNYLRSKGIVDREKQPLRTCPVCGRLHNGPGNLCADCAAAAEQRIRDLPGRDPGFGNPPPGNPDNAHPGGFFYAPTDL